MTRSLTTGGVSGERTDDAKAEAIVLRTSLAKLNPKTRIYDPQISRIAQIYRGLGHD